MPDLFTSLLSRGVDELFAAGETFKSIAQSLRAEGLHFADSRLRAFRDWALNGGKVPGFEYGSERIFYPGNMKPISTLEPGTYAYRIIYNAIDANTGLEFQGHTFEITDFYGNEQEILDNLIPRMINRFIEHRKESSDIILNSFMIDGAYKSIIE